MTAPFIRYDVLNNAVEIGPNLEVPGSSTFGAATFTGLVSLEAGAAMGGDLDMGGHAIHNLAAPTAPGDAANKAYVDSIVPGGAAAPPNMSVQYNNGGPFGGDPNFTWNAAGQLLTVGGVTPRVVLGGGAADQGAVLQLKSRPSGGAIAIGAAAAGPSTLHLQARALTIGAATAALQTLQFADHTAAYCDVTIVGVTTAGTLGQSNIFHRRFRTTRFDSGGGTTLSAIADDFTEAQTAGTSITISASGTAVLIAVTGAAGASLTWDAMTLITVSAGW